MICDDVRELEAAYALDALGEDERAAVAAHLATCNDHPDLAHMRATVLALGHAAEEEAGHAAPAVRGQYDQVSAHGRLQYGRGGGLVDLDADVHGQSPGPEPVGEPVEVGAGQVGQLVEERAFRGGRQVRHAVRRHHRQRLDHPQQ